MTFAIRCDDLWKSYAQGTRMGLKSLLVRRRTARDSRFSRQWVLRGVSFTVRRGQGYGVIGHNGTGKSTLLALLLGTVLPDRGVIDLRGRVAPLLELGAGFHPELTGRDNILLSSSILGMHLHEIRERFASIVEFSELADAIDAPLRTYSTGMITRLGFSVIANAPAEILLIDEVLGVGDARFQEKCRCFLRQFKRRNGTLVIVSHSLQELPDVCDEGLCLEMGSVASKGDIWEVIQRYRSSNESSAELGVRIV